MSEETIVAAKKTTTEDAPAFDPRSEAIVLAYQGTADGTPYLNGIPARDLTEADICRLVYARGVNEYDGEPDGPPHPDPLAPDQAACAALVALLLERKVDGHAVYATPDPTPDATTTETTTTPDAPATAEG